MTAMYADIIERSERELLESVVPFWEKHSPDREGGGFFNWLDRYGEVFDTNKFAWMQWRSVYMFARLYNSEYRKPEFLELARHGFEFSYHKMRQADGTYNFATTAVGAKLMPAGPYAILTETYVAIGCAELYRATGEERYAAEALNALEIFLDRLGALENPPEPPPGPRRRSLGVYMHLMLACATVLRCLGDRDPLVREVLNAGLDTLCGFYNPELRMWFEQRNRDGGFDLSCCTGRTITVGHSFEVLSFMTQGAKLVGRQDILERVPGWVNDAFAYGWDRKRGGIFVFLDALGKPRPEPSAGLKSWWTQTEAMLALINAYKLTGDASFLEKFRQVEGWAYSRFRDPDYPEWFSEVSLEGHVACEAKGLSSKTCYHLPRALFYIAQLLKEN